MNFIGAIDYNHHPSCVYRFLNNKAVSKTLAELHGIPVPKLYFASETDYRAIFPDKNMIVKPLRGDSSQERYLIGPGNGDINKIVESIRLYGRGIMYEEHIAPKHHDFPNSIKLFMCNQKCVNVIKCVHHADKKIWYNFDGNYNILRIKTSTHKPVDEHFEPPVGWDLYLEYASRLNGIFGGFNRIDFFETDNGPVFNEFCHRPAGGRTIQRQNSTHSMTASRNIAVSFIGESRDEPTNQSSQQTH